MITVTTLTCYRTFFIRFCFCISWILLSFLILHQNPRAIHCIYVHRRNYEVHDSNEFPTLACSVALWFSGFRSWFQGQQNAEPSVAQPLFVETHMLIPIPRRPINPQLVIPYFIVHELISGIKFASLWIVVNSQFASELEVSGVSARADPYRSQLVLREVEVTWSTRSEEGLAFH